MKRLVLSTAISILLALTLAVTAFGQSVEGKSMKKALFLSLLMPGAGQHYLGNTGRAKLMYTAEVGVWSAFTFYRLQGGMREDRYLELAEIFADVGGGRNDEYYRIIGYYVSNDAYNIDVMREARLRYPNDEDARTAYYQANGYFGDDGWQWESLEKQADFERTRTASRQSYRRAVLSTGFAALNRLVSMIDIYLWYRLGHADPSASYPMLRVEQSNDRSLRFCLSMPF